MDNCIYYFTGTGNSLYVARDIAKELGSCEIRAIKKNLRREKWEKFKRVGIAFPVYAWGMPEMVDRFIRIMEVHRETYLFAVATYCDNPGDTLGRMKEIFKERDLILEGGFYVQMPGTSMDGKGESMDDKKKKLFNWNRDKWDIIHKIKEKEKITLEKKSFTDRVILSGILYNIAQDKFKKGDNKFYVDGNCSKCGVCSEICPSDNVLMIKDKIKWMNNCQMCMACMNWCPREAIQRGRKTKGKPRYTNPDISLKDMLL